MIVSNITTPANHEVVTSIVNSIQPQNSGIIITDLQNLVGHSLALVEKNKSILSEDRLYCLKNSEVLNSREWNDVHVMDTFNTSAIFKNVIASYKEKLNLLEDPTLYFRDITGVSQDLTTALLKSILLFDGNEGMGNLRSSLLNIQSAPGDERWFACKKVYNILLYSAPFFLLAKSQTVILHAPYEIITSDLYSYSLCIDHSNLTFSMKLQASLESTLPQMPYLRQIYAISQYSILRMGMYWRRRYQISTVGLANVARLTMGQVMFNLPLFSGLPILTNTESSLQIVDVVSRTPSRTSDGIDREIISLFSS